MSQPKVTAEQIDQDGFLAVQHNDAGTVTSATDFDPVDGLSVEFVFGAAAVAEIGFTVTVAGGVEMTVEVTDGGQGTLTWGSEVLWASGTAPTLTAAGSDVLKFFTIDGGVNWVGWVVVLDYS